MIPLEKQLTSLELSQRLKELGVKQEGIFAWYQNLDGSIFCEYCQYQTSQDDESTYHDGYAKLPIKICIAPTVAELGIALPDWADFTQKHYNTTSKKTWYRCFTKAGITLIDNFKEADARAKMLIWLIENKLLGVGAE